MPRLEIVRLERVGDRTIAIELESPPDFEAHPGQFVLLRATIDGEEATGYYTISSPDADERFEITVEFDPAGTLGPWLANRTLGEELAIEGPLGNITYAGESDAVVLAEGPGIGPAVAIAERALAAGRSATVIHDGRTPAHARRLDDLAANGATVVFTDDLAAEIEALDPGAATIHVFGFQQFVEDAKRALEAAEIDLDGVEIESFGPR
jgi:ferredoxin-NADP reductase